MSKDKLHNAIRAHREALGLTQRTLAERLGLSRQALIAIEAGRQVPSTVLALALASALGCSVEALFSLPRPAALEVQLAAPTGNAQPIGARVSLAHVAGRWIAHALPVDGLAAADGILVPGSQSRVEPLRAQADLRRTVLIAGCAPLIAALGEHVSAVAPSVRVIWLEASTHRALELLEAGHVHLAGIHHTAEGGNAALIRRRFTRERMLLVNLTRWRQGFVLPPGNPLAIRDAGDLLRPDLRMAHREAGATAHTLVADLLAQQGAAERRLPGPEAGGHQAVAQLVRCGAADLGIAIESAAHGAGLDFVPLSEERFDLVARAALASEAPLARVLDVLGSRGFRTELAHRPGHDPRSSGEVSTLDAA